MAGFYLFNSIAIFHNKNVSFIQSSVRFYLGVGSCAHLALLRITLGSVLRNHCWSCLGDYMWYQGLNRVSLIPGNLNSCSISLTQSYHLLTGIHLLTYFSYCNWFAIKLRLDITICVNVQISFGELTRSAATSYGSTFFSFLRKVLASFHKWLY